jgi:hypothetical protein
LVIDCIASLFCYLNLFRITIILSIYDLKASVQVSGLNMTHSEHVLIFIRFIRAAASSSVIYPWCNRTLFCSFMCLTIINNHDTSCVSHTPVSYYTRTPFFLKFFKPLTITFLPYEFITLNGYHFMVLSSPFYQIPSFRYASRSKPSIANSPYILIIQLLSLSIFSSS